MFLEVEDLHVSYGKVEAVRGLDLQVRPGQVHLVIGPNGAGKTTTLETIAGLRRDYRGTVRLDGRPVARLLASHMVRSGVVLVPEGRRVFGALTCMDNLRLGAYVRKSPTGLAKVLDMFPLLAERRNVPAGLLSGGEQQMLAFGRALMSDPDVMLIDEPSMGLGPAIVERVFETVRSIADAGTAVLIVEQNVDAALEICDVLSVMRLGEVVYQASSTSAAADVEVLRAFLGESALAGDKGPVDLEGIG